MLIPDLEVFTRECQEHTGYPSKRDKELLRVKLNFFSFSFFFVEMEGGREWVRNKVRTSLWALQ